MAYVWLELCYVHQTAREHALHHLQHRRGQFKLCGQQHAQGNPKDSTHYRTGMCGMTWSTKCAAVCSGRPPCRERHHPARYPRRFGVPPIANPVTGTARVSPA